MGRAGDKTDVTMCFSSGDMEVADGQQPCVLALSAGIRLHGDGIKTGQLHQPIFQLLNHFLHSLRLF